MAKKARLDKIVGRLTEEKEEEPEGEELGESDTGNVLLSLPFFSDCADLFALLLYIVVFFFFFRWLRWRRQKAVNHRRGGCRHPPQLDGGGGQPALPKEKAQGLLAEVRKSSCSLFFLFFFCFDLPSISLVVLYVWIVTGYFLLLFLRVWDCSKVQVRQEKKPGD